MRTKRASIPYSVNNLLLPATLLFLFLASPAQAQLTRIGAAAAVRGRVEAVAPTAGAVGRIMSSGKEVYLRDAVTTDAQGRMQVMLLDETVFTIGPNSSLVLDEFVYDPNTGAGKMTARVTKGVFRFVTGKIARETPSNMKVKLPVGVIGIRGTIVMGKIFSPTSALAVLMGPGARNNADERPGQMVVSAGGKDSFASKPGSGIDVTPAGPSAPYAVPQTKIDEMSGDLAPKTSDAPAKGATGGDGTASSSEGSATEESGQTTASALNDLSTSQTVADAVQDNSSLTDNASQTNQAGIQDGFASWEDVRTIPGGIGVYSGASTYTCGGVCSGTGTMTLYMEIDFGTRIIGGGPSCLILSGLINDSVSIGPDNYTSLSGKAYLIAFPGSYFEGSTITLMNKGGVAAAEARSDLLYNDTLNNVTATGSMTIPR